MIWCINHDKNAILSHNENYPYCMHSIEDIRTIDLSPLVRLVNHIRQTEPTAKIAIWASLECTNFSRAKCGPKEADSRTLAEDMFRYLDAINPDFFWVENVEEFRTWGPLDLDGNPDKERLGEDYRKWVNTLKTKYFKDEYYDDTLIAADFGGRTIRKRLFLQFSKDARFIGIPVQTHCKNGENGEKWLPVKDVLDLNNHGNSIFTRKKPFVKNTHKRIYKGLIKFGPKEKFGYKYYGQGGFQDMNNPSCTLTTKDRVSLVHPVFLSIDYVHRVGRSIDKPASTLVTSPREGIVSVKLLGLKQDFGTSDVADANKPAGSLTTVPKSEPIFIKSSFVHNPQYGGSNRSIEDPACTVIARQDKAPLGLTTAVALEEPVFTKSNTDDPWMVKIKEYCLEYGIADILVRPLLIKEMLQIQGFPIDYKLKGTKTEQKKYIGNSVEVKTGVALFKAIDKKIQEYV